jgi:hypothetical protein
MMKQTGRIISGGMGGALNPPGDPEYTQCVTSGRNDYSSLRYVVDHADHYDDGLVARVRALLESFKPLPLDAPESQAWLKQCFKHWQFCYAEESDGTLYIDHDCDPMQNPDKSFAVRWVRKWYPEFVPTAEHFQVS